MASLADIVSVTITRSTAQISRASFGIPCIAAYHTKWADRSRLYSAVSMLSTLVSEGFATTDPVYRMAEALLSQSPRPSRIIVGRLNSSWTQSFTLTPTAASTTTYSGRVNDQPWSFTSDSDATLGEVCTGISGAIDALSGVTATTDSSTVTITVDTAATLVDVHGWDTSAGAYTVVDATAAGNVAADMATLRGADNRWYAFVTDRRSEAAINAIAGWAEANRVLYLADSADSTIVDSGVTTDVASDNAARKRTAIFLHKDLASTQFASAMLGLMMPYDPGSATWAHKSPAGVRDPGFSASQQANALTKKANIITTVAGITDTQWGTSGTDYLDNVQAEDWLVATLQEDVYAFLRSSPKIPYTDRSVARLVDVIRNALQRGVQRDVVADGSIVIEAPQVADVSPTDRANRLLPDVYFSCRLAGAIHTVEIQGLVSL